MKSDKRSRFKGYTGKPGELGPGLYNLVPKIYHELNLSYVFRVLTVDKEFV